MSLENFHFVLELFRTEPGLSQAIISHINKVVGVRQAWDQESRNSRVKVMNSIQLKMSPGLFKTHQ